MEYDYEETPGGYFLYLADRREGWAGLYRLDGEFFLLARCHGTPPPSPQLAAETVRELVAYVNLLQADPRKRP
ncbi:MAG: hypothetical protein CMJ58_15370 [Planctomycetaceae bacterium]|nr:hypothetical protein [Planctomycetaceae bacterium]